MRNGVSCSTLGGNILQAEAPDALTMRRITGEVGCSTSVLYTMFGGKAGVAAGPWGAYGGRRVRVGATTDGLQGGDAVFADGCEKRSTFAGCDGPPCGC
jgi:hypothetical protein